MELKNGQNKIMKLNIKIIKIIREIREREQSNNFNLSEDNCGTKLNKMNNQN